jgi:hypothetical protein
MQPATSGRDHAMIAASPALRDLLRLLPDATVVARSCKVSPTQVSQGRVLCSLDRAALAPAAGKAFLTLAAAFLDQSCAPLSPFVAKANAFHFALDPLDVTSGDVRKVYAELAAEPANDLAYIALKSATGPARLTRYLRRDLGRALQVLNRIKLHPALNHAFTALCQDLGSDVEYLEVAEDSSPRLSLDLNLSDVTPSLRIKRQILQIADEIRPASSSVCWPESSLSHLAIGQSASGVPFLTFYGFPESVCPQDRTSS